MTNTVSKTISDEQINRIIQIESAGNPNAKAPTSSAAGLGQFILGTWNAVVKQHRPDMFKDGAAPARVGTATAALQIEMLARFTEDNARALGAGFTDGDLYLAHFLGIGDARKLFKAAPGDAAASHVTAGAVAANKSILSGKTCAQVRAWAQASMVGRWDKAGRTDWVKKYAGVLAPPLPDVPPITPKPLPAPKAPTPKEAAKKTGIGAAIFTAFATAAAFMGEHPFIIGGGIVAIVGAFIAWRLLRKKDS